MIVEELAQYLGKNYQPGKLTWTMEHAAALVRGWDDFGAFQQREKEVLYLLAQVERDEWWWPHGAFLREVLSVYHRGGSSLSILEYPAGIGSFGLALAEMGYEVAFADYQGKPAEFLRWRLKRRKVNWPVYDAEKDEIHHRDVAVSFWTAQRYPPEQQWKFINDLAEYAGLIVMDLDGRWASLPCFHAVDGPALVEQIVQKYEVLVHKVVNQFVHLVVFKTGIVGIPDAGSKLEET